MPSKNGRSTRDPLNRNFRFSFQQPPTICLTRESSALFFLWLYPGLGTRVPSAPTRIPQLLTTAFLSGFVRHPSVPFGSGSIFRLPQLRLSRRKRQSGDPPEH